MKLNTKLVRKDYMDAQLFREYINLYSLDYLLKMFSNNILMINVTYDYIKINLLYLSDLYYVLSVLKNHSFFRYNILTDIICSDHIGSIKRFEISYNLLNLDYNTRLVIAINCNKFDIISSVTNLYLSANWSEREVWDMFGIFFYNHEDLRRILTDYGFSGYPLRKDFPLNGYIEIRYDEDRQYLIYESLELMQNMRYYSFKNPLANDYARYLL